MSYAEIKDAIVTDAHQREILERLVCEQCSEEFERRRKDFLPSATLEDYSCLEVGISARGLQVWCKRHSRNVAHLDLQRLKAKSKDQSSVRRSSSDSAFQTHQLTRLDE
jgi:hypothetical protein